MISLVAVLAVAGSPAPIAPPSPIEKSIVVPAPRASVYSAFTTSEGLTSFFAGSALVELELGGRYELHFSADAPEGSRGTEGCRVLAFLQDRLISFTWNAPPTFPDERSARTFVVVELEDDASPGGTRVRLTHAGFGEGGRWAEVREYFDAAWARVLEALRTRFVEGPRPARAVPPPRADRKTFVYFVRPARPSVVESPGDAERRAFRGHFEHMKKLAAEGRLVAAGPSEGRSVAPSPGGRMVALDMPPLPFGLCIFTAIDETEARKVMEGDPMVAEGFFEATLRPFTLAYERR